MVESSAASPQESRPQPWFSQPAFLRIHDVMRLTALSRPTIYRRIAAGRFPAPVHLGGRACAWSPDDLRDWIADPERYQAPAPGQPRRRWPGRPRKTSRY